MADCFKNEQAILDNIRRHLRRAASEPNCKGIRIDLAVNRCRGANGVTRVEVGVDFSYRYLDSAIEEQSNV